MTFKWSLFNQCNWCMSRRWGLWPAGDGLLHKAVQEEEGQGHPQQQPRHPEASSRGRESQKSFVVAASGPHRDRVVLWGRWLLWDIDSCQVWGTQHGQSSLLLWTAVLLLTASLCTITMSSIQWVAMVLCTSVHLSVCACIWACCQMHPLTACIAIRSLRHTIRRHYLQCLRIFYPANYMFIVLNNRCFIAQYFNIFIVVVFNMARWRQNWSLLHFFGFTVQLRYNI